jgi:hypothetical protein
MDFGQLIRLVEAEPIDDSATSISARSPVVVAKCKKPGEIVDTDSHARCESNSRTV